MIRVMNYGFLNNLLVQNKQVLKYLIAGGFVVTVNLSVLYTLTDFFGVYYLISTVCSFLVSFCVSFFLQKLWTFNDRDISKMRAAKQMTLYLCLQGSGLVMNATLMYVFVEYAHMWYIASQAIISFLIAIGSFLVSRRFIFTSTVRF